MSRRLIACVVGLMFGLGIVVNGTMGTAFAQGETATEVAGGEVDLTLVSLDFRDADIRTVLEVLALKSGVNIVASPDVTGQVSIQLTEVPWQQALEVILETYGYAYEQRKNIIVVTTVEDMRIRRENAQMLSEQEPLVTEIFTLNFAIASDVVLSLGKMVSERGQVDFDRRTNTIIVTDVRKQIDVIAGVVKQLDRTTPQVLIEAKIIETTLTDTENMGIDWTTSATVSGAARPHTLPFHESTSNAYAAQAFTSGGTFTYGTLDLSATQAVLQMLKSRDNTEILSNPKIVTLDNRPAVIEVGEEHPIPEFGANEETGSLQTTGLIYRNIGINFQVTPHVNNAGFVTLDVTPEVSETDASVAFQNINVPIISTERASTSVMVKDGETLVIAGLIKDKKTDVKKKMPLLGDIPILGKAFQKSNEQVTKQDLMIFITPHIITPEVTSN